MPYKDREKQLAYQREWQRKLVAQGLCRSCRRRRGRSKYQAWCTRCGDAHQKANRRWSKKKGAQWNAARRRKRIEQGLCTDCGEPSRRYRLCRKCRKRHNANDRQREREKRTPWSVRNIGKSWWRR